MADPDRTLKVYFSRGYRTHAGRGVAVLLALSFLCACAGTRATTPIGTILDDPSSFDGQTVRVRGEVTASFGVLTLGGGYRINDGSGTLTVVTEESGVPREGAEVEVEGTFRSVFSLGDQSVSVLEEGDRTIP